MLHLMNDKNKGDDMRRTGMRAFLSVEEFAEIELIVKGEAW